MITKLTTQQISRFPEFIDKWTRIGLSTDPADRERAERGVRLAYECAGLQPPAKIVWCGSPLSQGITSAIVCGLKDAEVKTGASVRSSVWASVGASVGDSVWDSVGDSVRASVRSSVWASVVDSVRSSVGDSVGDSVWDSVWASVRASVWASVRASVWASVVDSVGASVRDSVGASVRDSVRDSVGDSVVDSVRSSVGDSVGDSVWDSVGDSVRASVWASVVDSVRASVWASVVDSVVDSVGASVGDSVVASVYGQHDANWLGFYDYFKRACGLDDQTQKLAGLWEICQSAGWWLPHKNLCWVSERHNQLHRNATGRLHRDGGPALTYPDGWSIWALNGVRVPQWLAETTTEQLDPLKILAEQNAEVRREGVRKVGVERLVFKAGAKVLDTSGHYELLGVPIGSDRHGIALKMLNPSVPECWHVEFVDPRCATVQQALNFRNQLTAEMIDDENGAEFYQQGDVILRPRGATKFKSRPAILT